MSHLYFCYILLLEWWNFTKINFWFRTVEDHTRRIWCAWAWAKLFPQWQTGCSSTVPPTKTMFDGGPKRPHRHRIVFLAKARFLNPRFVQPLVVFPLAGQLAKASSAMTDIWAQNSRSVTVATYNNIISLFKKLFDLFSKLIVLSFYIYPYIY